MQRPLKVAGLSRWQPLLGGQHLHIEGTYGRVSLDSGDLWGELLQVGAALAFTYSPEDDD